MVGVNHKNLPSNFINAYISLDNEAFLIFDKTFDYDEIFYHYLEHTKAKNKDLTDIIQEEDEVVLKFTIPDQYSENYHYFLQGKYSWFTEDYKQLVCNYFGKQTRKDDYTVTEYNTLYPQAFKRRQIAERLYDKKDIEKGLKLIDEVLDKPDLDKEIYKSIEQLTQQYELKQTDDTLG